MVEKIEEGLNFLDYSDAMWRLMYLGPSTVDSPSLDEIRRLLQEAHDSVTLGFTPGLTSELLRQKYDSVFISGATAEPIRLICVYGTLTNLAIGFSGQHRDAAFSKRCRILDAHFSIQAGRAVNSLKLIIPTTSEAASALTMASGAAMELCRPLIAQSLSSKAASVVLSLGYN